MKNWTDYNIPIYDDFTGEIVTTCPECSHKRKKKNVKCLSCNGDKLAWHCNHCGWSGSLYEKGESENVWKPTEYVKPPEIEVNLPDKVVDWFEKRSIGKKVLVDYKISYGEIFMPQKGKEVKAIQFPYLRGEETVNIKYRDAEKNFRQVSQAEKIVYGYNDINKPTIIIVEGEMDKLSLAEVGIKNCFSVPDGAPAVNTKNYTSKFSYLGGIQETISNAKKIILMTDSDEAGLKLSEELGRRIGREKCWMVKYPDDCKDANEVLVKKGRLILKEMIEYAKPIPVAGIFGVEDMSDKVIKLHMEGLKRGLSTGFSQLDEFYTIRGGEWTIITGIPGHGKSSFIDNLMLNLMSKEDWKIAFFSPENLPIERHLATLAEKHSNLPFIEGYHEKMDRLDLESIMKDFQDKIFFIMPEENEMNLENILKLAKVLIYQKGVKGIVIDPWNEIDHSRERGLTETEYISQCLSKIRRFTRINNIHIWLVAHPTKLQKTLKGKYPVPTPYDISGSAHFRNKSDNALSIYRESNNEVYLHIQKIRFREVGKIGSAELKYNTVSGRYT